MLLPSLPDRTAVQEGCGGGDSSTRVQRAPEQPDSGVQEGQDVPQHVGQQMPRQGPSDPLPVAESYLDPPANQPAQAPSEGTTSTAMLGLGASPALMDSDPIVDAPLCRAPAPMGVGLPVLCSLPSDREAQPSPGGGRRDGKRAGDRVVRGKSGKLTPRTNLAGEETGR